jgi:hypothetical protein
MLRQPVTYSMRNVFAFLIFAWLGLHPAAMHGQDKKTARENLVEEDPIPADTSTTPKFVPRVGEKFDLVFNYTIPVSGAPAIAPMNILNSGNVSFYLSFNRIINKHIALKAMPGMSWYTLNFSVPTSTARRFPTPDTTLSSARTPFTSDIIRSFFFELPLAFTYTIQRDIKERPYVFIDVGASIGYKPFGSAYDRTYDAGSLTITERFEPIPNTQRWRVAAFVRVVYRLIGLHLNYRFTDVFFTDQGYGANAAQGGTNPYPRIPQLELGLTIVL